MRTPAKIALALGLALAAAPAAAQLPGLPVVGGVTERLPQPLTAPLEAALGRTFERLNPRTLIDERLQRLNEMVRANPRFLEFDDLRQPVVRGEVLATSPSEQSLAAARKLGFSVLRREALPELGLELVTLQAPQGLSAREAVRRLRRADPNGAYDFNHLYFGAADAREANPPAAASPADGPATIGMVDTGVDARHLALAAAKIEGRGFAAGGYRPAAHGLAVASLIAGRSAAPGARLFVADVYGQGPTGGSAEAVVRALGWMAEVRAPVVNMSLVGPPNRALEAGVAALIRRGIIVVAAVGNDGPAAPPSYPASYPGVVAVTGVDRNGKVLMEAGRALHVDFAAPGEVVAAQPGGQGLVRGTSFAAPQVAGRLAVLAKRGGDPVQALALQARDLGPKGTDKTYGRGLVGAEALAGR